MFPWEDGVWATPWWDIREPHICLCKHKSEEVKAVYDSNQPDPKLKWLI